MGIYCTLTSDAKIIYNKCLRATLAHSVVLHNFCSIWSNFFGTLFISLQFLEKNVSLLIKINVAVNFQARFH